MIIELGKEILDFVHQRGVCLHVEIPEAGQIRYTLNAI
jgi:hypothetical protein